MSESVIVQNTTTPEMVALAKKYDINILDALDANLDHIRQVAADKYIIKNRYAPERRPYILSKLQPSDPNRLTERTGALLKMLRKNLGQWDRGFRIHKSDNGALQCKTHAVYSDSDKLLSAYEATISVTEGKIASSFQDSTVSSTTQQLYFRFKWDMDGGIRGRRRPFLSAAANDEGIKVGTMVILKLGFLGVT